MSTTPNDTTLEALTSRVAALEQALASLQPHPPTPAAPPPASTMSEKPTGTRRFLRRAVAAAVSLVGALLKVSSRAALAAESSLPGTSGPCVCSSATGGVPAVQATGTSGAYGVNASSDSGIGLYTQSGSGIGLLAVGGGASSSLPKVRSLAIYAEGGPSYGLFATSDGSTGVYGQSNGSTGVYGSSDSGTGVSGQSSSSIGVEGSSDSYIGVQGQSSSNTGVLGFSDSGTGVSGQSNSNTGVNGSSDSDVGVNGKSSSNIGVLGFSDSYIGVQGQSISGTGVFGHSDSSFGVYAQSTSGYAGLFDGSVQVHGLLWKSGGGFQIDHPLDAAHKYLSHSFVESSDMKNLYDGLVTLDANGQAEVRLPAWFETLNTDVCYQLTCLGGYAPVYIAEKLQNNRFTIAGGQAGMEVCWQVTGIRQDRWASAHRIAIEQDKPAQEQGYYLHPDLYGEPEEKSTLRARYPDLQRPVPPQK